MLMNQIILLNNVPLAQFFFPFCFQFGIREKNSVTYQSSYGKTEETKLLPFPILGDIGKDFSLILFDKFFFYINM